MRKHITQAQILKIEKLLNAGITDRAEIQSQVYVHSECIDRSIAVHEARIAAAKKPATKKRAAPKKVVVDPLS